MRFRTLRDLEGLGFTGFNKISELRADCNCIPVKKGIYLVLFLNNEPPQFQNPGSGGYFKGKDPNVAISKLEQKWVNNTIVLYIGKAGKENAQANLRQRIKNYIRFGQGINASHYGGRFIWQIQNNSDLIICWKNLDRGDPRAKEKDLIRKFKAIYSTKPFANLRA